MRAYFTAGPFAALLREVGVFFASDGSGAEVKGLFRHTVNALLLSINISFSVAGLMPDTPRHVIEFFGPGPSQRVSPPVRRQPIDYVKPVRELYQRRGWVDGAAC